MPTLFFYIDFWNKRIMYQKYSNNTLVICIRIFLVQHGYLNASESAKVLTLVFLHQDSAGADPENFSRGGPTLSKKKPITHT